MDQRQYYFSTRDLLMMAALAALGSVVSTYVNAIGDFFQSILGFAGTTQWAAGLHVLWLTLADVQKCEDCLVAFRTEGGLLTVMPGMPSNTWVKGVISIEVK